MSPPPDPAPLLLLAESFRALEPQCLSPGAERPVHRHPPPQQQHTSGEPCPLAGWCAIEGPSNMACLGLQCLFISTPVSIPIPDCLCAEVGPCPQLDQPSVLPAQCGTHRCSSLHHSRRHHQGVVPAQCQTTVCECGRGSSGKGEGLHCGACLAMDGGSSETKGSHTTGSCLIPPVRNGLCILVFSCLVLLAGRFTGDVVSQRLEHYVHKI